MKTIISFALIFFIFQFGFCFAADTTLNIRISLISVEGPESVNKSYYKSGLIPMLYEDDSIRIIWEIPKSMQGMFFTIKNKADQTIRILWDRTAFVDEKGISHRITHQGVKYNERNNPQPPTILMKQSILQDILIPTDSVYWQDGVGAIPGRWEIRPLFRNLNGYILGEKYYPGFGESLQEIQRKLAYYNGKIFHVLLSIEMYGKIKEYIFGFSVEKLLITDLAQNQKPSVTQWVVLDSFPSIKIGKSTKKEVVSKYGTPNEEDEEMIIYRSNPHADFENWRSLKFIFDASGRIIQIRGQK